MRRSAISSAGQSVGLRTKRHNTASAREVRPGTHCAACGRRVLWAASGHRRIALEPTPQPMGEFLFAFGDVTDGVQNVQRLGRGETFPVASLFYVGHASKCRGGR